MGKTITEKQKSKMDNNARNRMQSFDGRKTAKLGTEKNPAVVHVQTEERLKEVQAICEQHNWKCTVTVEPDKAENIAELERLLNPARPTIAEKKIGRNEPCSCGSGKKYKHCCGK